MATNASPRVLVVAYDFPPHAAIGTMRTLRVVRQLHATGWEVSVLTSDPRSYLPTTPVDQALLDKVPEGVRIIRAGSVRAWDKTQRALVNLIRPPKAHTGGASAAAVGQPAEPAHGRRKRGILTPLIRIQDVVDASLSIPDRELGWLLPALGKGVLDQIRSARADVIYASSPPWTGMLVAAGLKTALRRPLVADFRDPWSRAPWRGDKYRFAMRAAAALERRVIRRADRVVFVARGNHDDFVAHYGPDVAAKFHVVSNGCDPTEFDSIERPLVPADGMHVMLHAGSLYAGRTPVPLFKAIATAIERGIIDPSRFRLRFLGSNGMRSVDLPAACRELGIDSVVEFLPRVPRAEAVRAMTSASSLFLLQPGHTVSVPGKVYEYLAAGRPVFSIAEEGETAQIVRESGIGISVAPEDDAGILAGMAAIIRMAGQQVDPAPRALYDGHLGAKDIERILRSALPASVNQGAQELAR